MTEDQAIALALDAMSSLDSIRDDVSELKGIDSDILALLKVQAAEVPQPDEADLAPLPLADFEPSQVFEVAASSFEGFAHDLMSFQYMQLTVSVFLLLGVLLNFGATLWLAFSDKWRS